MNGRGHRGLAGMFIIVIVLLGTVAWVYQNNIRAAQLVSKETGINEIRSNRIGVVRNIIERTYAKTAPENRALWAGFVQEKLAAYYQLQIAVDMNSFPHTVSIEDQTYGMSSRFVLNS